jgi:hypothetical protein
MRLLPLVPAKAGTQEPQLQSKRLWIPACAGMNGVCGKATKNN